MQLTTKQKAYLRGLGQSLRPQLHVSHEGLKPGTFQALEDLFRGRELVKVRMTKTALAEPDETAEELARRSRAAVVGGVGLTFLLYRPNPDLKDRIELPESTPEPARGPARPRRA